MSETNGNDPRIGSIKIQATFITTDEEGSLSGSAPTESVLMMYESLLKKDFAGFYDYMTKKFLESKQGK